MLQLQSLELGRVRKGLIPLKKPSDFERGCELRLSFDGCDRFHPGSSSCDWCRWLELCQFPEVLGGGCEGKFVLNATWAA